MSACIIWHGAISDGYGVLGRRLAHRLVWEECFGPLAAGVVVHHECGEKRCVNPEHLRPLTVAEHMAEHDNIHRARAVSVANRLARTHCQRGHAYAAHGYVIPAGQRDAGSRQCRRCHADRRREVRAARREALLYAGR